MICDSDVTHSCPLSLSPQSSPTNPQPSPGVPNACTFLFKKEDHTLANLLRTRLLKDTRVLFSAYKVPHPLFAEFELRVQTDGSVTPKDALIHACRDIVQDLDKLSREFTKEWELKRISRMDGMSGAHDI